VVAAEGEPAGGATETAQARTGKRACLVNPMQSPNGVQKGLYFGGVGTRTWRSHPPGQRTSRKDNPTSGGITGALGPYQSEQGAETGEYGNK
jgi:hypothetical protein